VLRSKNDNQNESKARAVGLVRTSIVLPGMNVLAFGVNYAAGGGVQIRTIIRMTAQKKR